LSKHHKICSGDLGRIYHEHGHVVLRRAQRLLGNESDAQEVLQEIFLSLVARPSQFEGRASITTFLYGMTTNHCLNRLRNMRKRGQLLEQKGGEASISSSGNEERLIAKEFLSRLPAKLATVAVHYYIDEMTQEEISEILGCSRRMVGKWLAKLHKHIEKEDNAQKEEAA